MPSLLDIPGAGAYYQRTAQNQQQPMQELQQAGAMLGLRQKMEEQQRAEAYRAAVAELGANPTHEQLAQVASKYAPPSEALKIHQSAQDRAAAREVAVQAAADRRAATQAQIDLRYDALSQQARNEEDKRSIETRRAADKAEADKRHDETLRLLGQVRSDAAANKPPAGYRFKPDRSLEAIPGGPADLKAQATAQRAADGATDVDVAIGTLRDAYDRLEKGGGITSTKNEGMDNLPAAISSSGVGQAVGRMFGTQNQSARNDIAMARPALLAALMKATGMSAKQMDSNAELKLWLATATDPTLDVESNRRALANIEKKYLRTGATPAAPGGAPSQFQEGQTATGPGGQKIIFKGGKWQPATSP